MSRNSGGEVPRARLRVHLYTGANLRAWYAVWHFTGTVRPRPNLPNPTRAPPRRASPERTLDDCIRHNSYRCITERASLQTFRYPHRLQPWLRTMEELV